MKLTIFDLDNTILNGDSDYSWIEFLIKNNYVDAKSSQAELSATARQLIERPKAEAGRYDIGPASDCKRLAKQQFVKPQDTMLSSQSSS